jgi:hypothetical protein
LVTHGMQVCTLIVTGWRYILIKFAQTAMHLTCIWEFAQYPD